MTIQFFFANGKMLTFQEITRKSYRGVLLPGSNVQQSNIKTAVITVQEFRNPLFSINHCLLEIFSKIKFTISESPGLRFEALLTGEMYVTINGTKRKFRAGEYRLTDVPLFTAIFRKDTSCSFFMAHYSAELLEQLGIEIVPCPPQKMPDQMSHLINELLHNPYTDKLREFYYQNCVRELLFLHLTKGKNLLPGELMNKDIELVYKADSIIAANLQEHYTIEELSRMSGTNKLKLKKGFRLLFGMGAFHRLIFRRMEQAKLLLEDTDKSIGEIARLTGYDTAAGFIHAFRRESDMTPREWRNRQKEDEASD